MAPRPQAEIDVYSHLRQEQLPAHQLGPGQGQGPAVQGEDSLGFNLFYGGHGMDDDDGNFIRAGRRFHGQLHHERRPPDGPAHRVRLVRPLRHPRRHRAASCAGPCMDRTAAQRPRRPLLRRAGPDLAQAPGHRRIRRTASPPRCVRLCAAFGKPPIAINKSIRRIPSTSAQWKQWAQLEAGLHGRGLEGSRSSASARCGPTFLSLTQSQYGWSAFTDGYYFNVVRSLPITSGHGGYHDFGPGYFNPSYSLEMARARDYWKPCWYLPTWYGNTTSRPVPAGTVPVVPDQHPGHDVAARPGAGRPTPAAGRASSSPIT